MCGYFVAAFEDRGYVPDRKRLMATASRLGHRGPDANAVHVEPGIGLAHTRLALLDPDPRSNQPFWDDTGRFALLYNGEVYNFRSLRDELETEGHPFRSTGDTEVVLRAVLAWGAEEAVARFDGMFSFALYDRDNRILTVARDPQGIKPLWICEHEDSFMFASECKAFEPWHDSVPDPLEAAGYLASGCPPMTGHTLYRGIRIVPGGSLLTVRMDEGTMDRTQYTQAWSLWDPDYAQRLQDLSADQITDEADRLLSDAVSSQLFADAPVGAFCSGGVDSSLLTAMAASTREDLAIFHADVVGRHSEFEAARDMADHLGLELAVVQVRDEDFIDHLPYVLDHFEHPFSYHPSSVPFLAVSRLVRSHGVKGVLSGEGSDECFLGYPRIPIRRSVQPLHRTVSAARRALSAIPKLGKFLVPGGDSSLIVGLLQHFEQDHEAIIPPQVGSGPEPDAGTRDTISLLGYHLQTLLHRNDTLGMASSVEARFPFLSRDVVRFAVNLPERHKLRFSMGGGIRMGHPLYIDKWVVRKVADRYLPRALSRRRKRGFPTDAYERMAIDDRFFHGGFVEDLFELESGQQDLLLSNADRQLRRHLMQLEAWGRICILKEPPEQIRQSLHAHVTVNENIQ